MSVCVFITYEHLHSSHYKHKQVSQKGSQLNEVNNSFAVKIKLMQNKIVQFNRRAD